MDKVVGDRIKRLRERRDWSQLELAEKIKMNNSVLSRIEDGTRSLRTEELNAIADVLDVSVDYLLGRQQPEINKKSGSIDPDSAHYIDFLIEFEKKTGLSLKNPETRDTIINTFNIVRQIHDLKDHN